MQLTSPAGKLVGIAAIVFLIGMLVGYGDIAVVISVSLLLAALITWVLMPKPEANE